MTKLWLHISPFNCNSTGSKNRNPIQLILFCFSIVNIFIFSHILIWSIFCNEFGSRCIITQDPTAVQCDLWFWLASSIRKPVKNSLVLIEAWRDPDLGDQDRALRRWPGNKTITSRTWRKQFQPHKLQSNKPPPKYTDIATVYVTYEWSSRWIIRQWFSRCR